MIFLDQDSFWDFLSKVELQTMQDTQAHPTYVSLNKAVMQDKTTAEIGVEIDAICLGEHDLEMLITPPAKMYFQQDRRMLVFDDINELFTCMLKIHDEIQENITRYPALVRQLYSIAKNAIDFMQMVVYNCELIGQLDRLKLV
jgi:hypothetical protein